MALPTITETYNDIFFRAWYSIRDQVIDSIFKVHPVWDRLYERAKTQLLRSMNGNGSLAQ